MSKDKNSLTPKWITSTNKAIDKAQGKVNKVIHKAEDVRDIVTTSPLQHLKNFSYKMEDEGRNYVSRKIDRLLEKLESKMLPKRSSLTPDEQKIVEDKYLDAPFDMVDDDDLIELAIQNYKADNDKIRSAGDLSRIDAQRRKEGKKTVEELLRDLKKGFSDLGERIGKTKQMVKESRLSEEMKRSSHINPIVKAFKLGDTETLRNIMNKTSEVKLDINIGDILLGGRFKNKRIVVRKIGVDELGQPTINGQKLLSVRIEKQLPEEKKSSKTKEQNKEDSN